MIVGKKYWLTIMAKLAVRKITLGFSLKKGGMSAGVSLKKHKSIAFRMMKSPRITSVLITSLPPECCLMPTLNINGLMSNYVHPASYK